MIESTVWKTEVQTLLVNMIKFRYSFDIKYKEAKIIEMLKGGIYVPIIKASAFN